MARTHADAIDALRASGGAPSPLAGIPISIKDLFDVEGQVTRAGSKVLDGAAPAEEDATVVARLRQAGLIPFGRTNMTEFAYSGLGLNPHYGTPLAPYDRSTGRAPGGSSAGAAVSVADGMAFGAMGTDTGGSCRIPAAMCGITGFKPTANRVSQHGVMPLSSSLDSVGPLANSVACCALLDAIISDTGHPRRPAPRPHVRLGVLANYANEDLAAPVAQAYEAALTSLSKAGVTLLDITIPALGTLPELNARGGLIAAEAYAWHKSLLADKSDRYDPRVGNRIALGARQTAAEYIDLLGARRRMIAGVRKITRAFDAIVMPTIPILPPTLAELAEDEVYFSTNLTVLRNPSIGNFLDRCAISLPVTEPGAPPVSIMLMGENGGDVELFETALAVEKAISASTGRPS